MAGEEWKDKEPEIRHVQVRGKDPQRWAELQGKFVEAVTKLLDTVVDESGRTVRDETREVSGRAIGALKALLEKPAVDNEVKIAEIEKTLAEAEKAWAEADKIAAEAEDQRFETMSKKFNLLMKYRSAIFLGGAEEPTCLFAENPEALVDAATEATSEDQAPASADPSAPEEAAPP